MEYERKELVDWIRGIYQNLDEADKQDALRFFPELRESEDEQVRKSIVATIKQCPDDFLNPKNRDKMLAYLEKQKEPKLTPDDLQKSFEAGQKSIVDNPEQYGLCKKAEWSKEDERIVGRIQMILEFYDRNYPADMNIGSEVPKYISWLKSLRPVKQEWSKKDEDKLYQVMETLLADKTEALRDNPHCKALHEAYDDMLAWLKSLRPQPQGIYQQVVKGLRDMCDRYEQNGMFTDGRARDFLDNVRVKCKDAIECAPILDESSWKPSEEQMEALRNAFHKLSKTDVADSVRLSIMYDNLKKL